MKGGRRSQHFTELASAPGAGKPYMKSLSLLSSLDARFTVCCVSFAKGPRAPSSVLTPSRAEHDITMVEPIAIMLDRHAPNSERIAIGGWG